MKLWSKEVETEKVQLVPSLGLGAAISVLPRHRQAKILDLGPANSENVAFFSQFGCQLEIFDLYSSITESRSQNFGTNASSPSPVSAAVERFRQRAEITRRASESNTRETFDLMLAWDLFDYMTQAEIAELFAGLKQHTERGARLLVFVSYRGPIPSRPRRYQIADRKQLAFDDSTPNGRPSPGYKEHQLLKLLPGFEVESCFLMRHGIQEYVFVENG